MTHSSKNQRLDYIDAAKGLGIFLVFYGHLIEFFFRSAATGGFGEVADAMASQWNLIYSFHMPLFFALAGAVHKPSSKTLGQLLIRQLVTRYGPALFYGSLSMGIYFVLMTLQTGQLPSVKQALVDLTMSMLQGQVLPQIVVTWFFFCLSSMEILSYCLERLSKHPVAQWWSSKIFLGLAVLGCTAVGIALYQSTTPNYHYIVTSLICLPFFYFGKILKASKIEARSLRFKIAVGFVAFSVLVAVHGGLHGTDSKTVLDQTVLLVDNRIGDFSELYLSGIAGILLVSVISTFLTSNVLFCRIGKNSLHLFCLNGLMFVFVNAAIAENLQRAIGVSLFTPLVVIIAALGIALLQIALAEAASKAIAPVYSYLYQRWSALGLVLERKLAI
jgi:acyltransferase